MSSASQLRDSLAPTEYVDTLRSTARSVTTAVAFWTAVGLPFVILVTLANGMAQARPAVFTALLLANVLALVAGRDHNR